MCYFCKVVELARGRSVTNGATPFSLHYPPYSATLGTLAGCASLLAPPAATASWTQLGLQATTAAPLLLHAPEPRPAARCTPQKTRRGAGSGITTAAKLMPNPSILDVTLTSVHLGAVKLMFRNICLAFFSMTNTALKVTNSHRPSTLSYKLYKSRLGKNHQKQNMHIFLHAGLR